jgi:S-adenosylmethionine-dependent methyltransferase
VPVDCSDDSTSDDIADDVADIQRHYVGYAEAEEDRLSRHPIEFTITRRYLEQHLPPDGHILEVGCATGRYTVALAERGHTVTAVDLTPELVERCEANVRRAGVEDRVSVHVADGRDLSEVPGDDFDAGLLMGPLYHLIRRKDRHLAITQVVSRLKPGAPFFSAHISRYGAMADVMKKIPDWVEDRDRLEYFMANGHEGDFHPRDGSFRGYFATPDELPRLHEEAGLETVTVAASDPAGTAIEATYQQLPDHLEQIWLDVLFRMSAEPSYRGAWCHMLYIGRKP